MEFLKLKTQQKSLRFLKKPNKKLKQILLILFFSSLIINVFSIFYSSDKHFQSIENQQDYLIRYNVYNKNEIIEGYHTKIKSSDELNIAISKKSEDFNLEKMNNLIFESIQHSDKREILFFENWSQWILSKIYNPLKKTQDAILIVDSGMGICSEVVTVMKKIALTNNLNSRIIGLNGHVLIEVYIDDKWYLADPDYGFIFDSSYEQILSLDNVQIKSLISKKLSSRGFNDKFTDTYFNIFTSIDDNIILSEGEFLSHRLYFLEMTLKSFNWFFTLISFFMLLFFYKRK